MIPQRTLQCLQTDDWPGGDNISDIDPIEFNDDPLKTVQAAALFLKLNQQPMEYMKLIKLLYLADRIALERMDETITGDKYVSMEHGPVLRKVYGLITHGPIYDETHVWVKHISPPQGYCVELCADPGKGELCEEEEKIIEDVYKKFGSIEVWNISNLTHFIPEGLFLPGRAIPLPIENILRELGKTKDDIKAIRKNIANENCFDRQLAGSGSLDCQCKSFSFNL